MGNLNIRQMSEIKVRTLFEIPVDNNTINIEREDQRIIVWDDDTEKHSPTYELTIEDARAFSEGLAKAAEGH